MMMGIFEFRDLAERHAFVLAADAERGTVIFKHYLTANGGDPDTIMWKQWEWDELDEGQRKAFGDAFSIDREGLLSCDAAGRWVFIVPVGDWPDLPPE